MLLLFVSNDGVEGFHRADGGGLLIRDQVGLDVDLYRFNFLLCFLWLLLLSHSQVRPFRILHPHLLINRPHLNLRLPLLYLFFLLHKNTLLTLTYPRYLTTTTNLPIRILQPERKHVPKLGPIEILILVSSIGSGLHDLLQFLVLCGGNDRDEGVLDQAVLAVADLARLGNFVVFIC